MKRLVVVLSGLLVLPAFAEVAPISYDEIVEYSDEQIASDDAIAEEQTTEKIVTPVVQPSRVSPRGATASSRAASRAVPSGASQNSRNISARNTSSSRNAAVARTGAATVKRSDVVSAARVASRPSRNASAQSSSGVTARSATPVSQGVTARAGALIQTDTVNTPLYTGRVSTRSSTAIQARAPSVVSISSGATTTSVDTDITSLDELAQLTDYCKAQYTSCMDNFCNVLDDNQGRCSCSKNLKNYEKTETALKSATEALQDVAQQIQYIGLTSDQVETLFTQTEAELEMQNTRDNTQLKNDLDNIKDMIVGIKTNSATSAETGLSFDLSGLLDFNIDSTGFDLTGLFGGTSNTNSISNQRGEQLYKTATARCKTAVLNTCQAQGVDISVITNSYDLEIDKQCIAYERSLNEANDNMSRTVRNAKAVLQKARLMVAQQKNTYDLRGCVNALDSCMQDEYVCGSDYEGCLDPTGKYIVNGEIVAGSAPGKANDIEKTNMSGLYSVWNYDDGSKNAWADNATLAEYISDSMANNISGLKGTTDNLALYLQSKIGYHDDSTNKNYGMCISVLNQCQDYTYKDKKYIVNNQVVSEYLQRTLVRIKAAQDEMLSDYAENCLNDVASCLQQNNSSSYYYSQTSTYEDISNVAINACKSVIRTCRSVTDGATDTTVTSKLKDWLEDALSAKTSPVTPVTVEFNGIVAGWAEDANYAAFVPETYSFVLPTNNQVELDSRYANATLYWCYNIGGELKCRNAQQGQITMGKSESGQLADGGATIYASIAGSQSGCEDKIEGATWTGAGCVCPEGTWFKDDEEGDEDSYSHVCAKKGS